MGRFLSNLLAELCAGEVMAWLPWIALRITRVAVRALPKAHRERYEEEWRGHLNEVPGALTKLGLACGFAWAAVKTRFDQVRVAEITFYYGVIVPFLALMLPMMGFMSAVWALRARRGYVASLLVDMGSSRDLQITIDRIPLGLALHLALSPHVSLESLDRSSYHYSIWCPSLSVEIEEFIGTRVLHSDPFLRFGMKKSPLPLGWRNAKVGASRHK